MSTIIRCDRCGTDHIDRRKGGVEVYCAGMKDDGQPWFDGDFCERCFKSVRRELHAIFILSTKEKRHAKKT